MGINSVAELETHPVTLCRYSDNEWSSPSKGWYIEPKKSMLDSLNLKLRIGYHKIKHLMS
jgi:hypothetical protein